MERDASIQRMRSAAMAVRSTTASAVRRKSVKTADAMQRFPVVLADGDRRSALDKALIVLEAVVARPRPVGLPDLSAELGLPRQTIHRILQQLADNRLLVRDPSRDRYAIGPRLSHLALSSLSSANQGAPVRAILTDLVNAIGETCNVGVLDGLDFVYLDRVECSWSLRVHLQPGSRVPAYCTSGGKVLLAHLDPPLRAGLLRSRTLEPHTGATMTVPSVLEAELDQVRTRGFAMNDEEFTVGIVGAAVPILDKNGRALGALALHGPSPRLSIARARSYLPQLKAAAEKLSRVWSIGEDKPASKRPE